MITNFKIFESICEMPKIGDYILYPKEIIKITDDDHFNELNIGKIEMTHSNFESYLINNFENGNRYITIPIKDMKKCKWSENIKELEKYLMNIKEKKYNL